MYTKRNYVWSLRKSSVSTLSANPSAGSWWWQILRRLHSLCSFLLWMCFVLNFLRKLLEISLSLSLSLSLFLSLLLKPYSLGTQILKKLPALLRYLSSEGRVAVVVVVVVWICFVENLLCLSLSLAEKLLEHTGRNCICCLMWDIAFVRRLWLVVVGLLLVCGFALFSHTVLNVLFQVDWVCCVSSGTGSKWVCEGRLHEYINIDGSSTKNEKFSSAFQSSRCRPNSPQHKLGHVWRTSPCHL